MVRARHCSWDWREREALSTPDRILKLGEFYTHGECQNLFIQKILIGASYCVPGTGDMTLGTGVGMGRGR